MTILPLALAGILSFQQASVEEPPNVLIVLVDDLGWADLGVGLPGTPGVKEHRTPHIAAFAKESLACIRTYSAAPNCAPSRATLQTGRATPRHGILTVGSPKRGKDEHRLLEPPKSRRSLAPEEITLAELVKPAGYSTAHVGKWHLGDDPKTQGYDINIGGSRSGHPKSYFSPYQNPSLADGPEGEHLTTRLTNEAIGLLDRLEPPFLMHLAYYTVHTPLQAPKERIEERRAAGAKHPKYAAMVESLDTEFGRLMAALAEKGLADNTLVVFTSDNGGSEPVTDKTYLRGYKGTLDEGGIRVPTFVRLPNRIRPSVTPEPQQHADLFPTIAALTGAPLPDILLDGTNLLPHWTARTPLSPRNLVWHFPCYLEGKSDRFPHWRTTPATALTESGRWKIIQYYEATPTGDPHIELYDLHNDLQEVHDLSAKYPEKLGSLMRELVTWRKGVGAKVPAPK